MNNQFDKSNLTDKVEKSIDNTKENVYDLANKALDAGKEVKDTATEKAQELSGDFKKSFNDTKNQLLEDGSELVSEAKKLCSKSYERTKEQMCKCQDDVSDFIKEKPLKSALIALGMGFLTATILARKNTKKHHRDHKYPH